MVFEGLVAVDEDNWDLIGEPAAQLVIALHVNLPNYANAMVTTDRLVDSLSSV